LTFPVFLLMLDKQQVAQLLGSTEIFTNLQPKHLEAIANACKVVRYDERARIVTQGEMGQELYIVAKGEVSVVNEDTELGIEQPILTLGPRQSFGEASLLAEAPRSATVKALHDSVCVVLAKRSFDSVLSQIPEVGLQISRYLAVRLHRQCQLTGFRFVSYEDLVYDRELFDTFPEAVLRRAEAIPLTLHEGTLTVALTRPNQASTIKLLREAAPGLAIEPVACTSEDYLTFINRHRPRGENAVPTISVAGANGSFRLESGQSVEGALAALFSEVFTRKLNHVLVQSEGSQAEVLTPTEGGLATIFKLEDQKQVSALNEQVKELFFPQERRSAVCTSNLLVGEARCQMQLAQLPTLGGLRYSFRFLEPKSSLPQLKELLPHQTLREQVTGAVSEMGNFVLLCGKPRSGLSTTVYTLLTNLQDKEGVSNFLTLEQRPLADLEGVPQVKLEDDLEKVLEASILHAPELLVVDPVEFGALPTLFRSAEAGHTTLACAVSTEPLEDLAHLAHQSEGREVNLDSVTHMLHQYLLPRLCPACRVEYNPSGAVKAQLTRNDLVDGESVFYRSEGCKECRGTGHRGKVAVLESLTLTPLIRELIVARRPYDSIRKTAKQNGLLVPFSASTKIFLKQGDLAPTTALRFFGKS